MQSCDVGGAVMTIRSVRRHDCRVLRRTF